ncbi:MAG: antibiotic biosynthesis monooxygenase [Candidatus Latescibacteria bacterium]|nr:antibiotic biosynthesis monooxygenase [Candidatus Latescibacterota bacterium]
MSVLSYLKLDFKKDEELLAAEEDITRMLDLVKQQKGFQSVEVLKAVDNPKTYVFLSYWDTVDDIRAWEHQPDHEAVMDRYDYELVHKRYEQMVRKAK